MDKYAIIVAGGAGARMGTALPKQFLLLQGRPVLWHSITAFLTAFNDIRLIVVLPSAYMAQGRSIIATIHHANRMQVTEGGDTRFQSVKNGLALVETKSVVFVHDGVRCLVTPTLLERCYETALQQGNAIPATRATDSVRIENDNSNQVINRNKVRMIQTPQTFLSETILKAFEQPYDEAFTDEASVVEKMGIAIHLVEGENTNIKITHPLDLLLAEKILEERNASGLLSPTSFI